MRNPMHTPYPRQVMPTECAPIEFAQLANPILLINDAPDLVGGLSRIGRDIASIIATMPEFRVGYLGRGGCGKRGYPWAQYQYPVSGQWGEEYLADVWNDFSGGSPGIIMSLWDVSRMLWFSNPRVPDLKRFLGNGRNFLKWGYFPVDGRGPNMHSYGVEMSAALQGYDRVIAASEWGADTLERSYASNVSWIPHGFWPDKFAPSSVPAPHQGKPMLGCVMANQARKDWPVAFECAAHLLEQYGNKFLFWAHTDKIIGYWNLHALAADYGMRDNLLVTNVLDDWQMRQYYSQCQCTILPSGGEGFGYPIVESMACGTPCVVTDYAAGQELVEPECRSRPVAFRLDTQYNIQRAVLNGGDFAQRAYNQIKRKQGDPAGIMKAMTDRVQHLEWPRIEHVWKRWLLEGLEN